ncbi:MAG TPA: hypothetical protein VGE16_05270 [Albitalea sp.]
MATTTSLLPALALAGLLAGCSTPMPKSPSGASEPSRAAAAAPMRLVCGPRRSQTCAGPVCHITVWSDAQGRHVHPYNLIVTRQPVEIIWILADGGRFDKNKNHGIDAGPHQGQFSDAFPTDGLTSNPPPATRGQKFHTKFTNTVTGTVTYDIKYETADGTQIICDPTINNSSADD